MKLACVASLGVVLVGCRLRSNAAELDAGAAAVTPVVASSAPVKTTSASRDAGALAGPEEVARRWNEAHSKHDVKALEGLYAAHVQFYGQPRTGKQCAAAKGAAFAKSPDYSQTIKDVSVTTEDGAARVSFTKTSTSGGKSADFPAVLVVVGGLITGETDKVTDANLAQKATHDGMWCLEVPWIPNDKVVAPYKISLRSAYQRARYSAHFKAIEATMPGVFIDFGQMSCPTKCEKATRECGYDLRLENHDPSFKGTSNLIEWVYVDAQDELLWYEDTKKGAWVSEPLPPLPK